MKDKKRVTGSPIGGTFLLVIFSVLCLLVFSILTVTTALAEKKLSDSAADSVEAYYKADLQAEEIFADLRGGTVPEEVKVQNGLYSFSCEVSAGTSLDVVLKCADGKWTVLQWKTVSLNQ